MKKYFVKTPWWLKRLFPSYLWRVSTKEKIIYLTFDDGPHPEATPFVLDELKKHGAAATFFCIGKNVAAEPALYQRIQAEGHAVGNHTQHHLNGWKTKNERYLADIAEAAGHIDTRLFRPPYGRIGPFQAGQIKNALNKENAVVVMWDVLSGDFDQAISGQQCAGNVIQHGTNGSVVVFHDSAKAFPRLKSCLPLVLDFFERKGFRFEKLEDGRSQKQG